MEKMMSMLPFVIWMFLYLPCLCIAEYFSVKSGHSKMSEESEGIYLILYLIVGFILLLYGC